MTIESIVVVAGSSTTDPRLAEIDLRKRLRSVRLTIVGPDGAAVRPEGGQALVLIEESPGDHELDAVPVFQGTATVITERAAVDVLVAARGYVPEQVRGITKNRQIALRPSPKVTLRVRGGRPSLPAGVTLRLALRRQRPDPRVCVFLGQRRTLESLMNSGRSASVVDPRGAASLQVTAPGSFAVEVSLRCADGRAVVVQSVTPAVIDVPAGRRARAFELTIPDAALQAALKAAARRGGR